MLIILRNNFKVENITVYLQQMYTTQSKVLHHQIYTKFLSIIFPYVEQTWFLNLKDLNQYLAQQTFVCKYNVKICKIAFFS